MLWLTKDFNCFYHNLSSLLNQVADGSRGKIKVSSLQGAQHHCVRDVAGSKSFRVKNDDLEKEPIYGYLNQLKSNSCIPGSLRPLSYEPWRVNTSLGSATWKAIISVFGPTV